MGEGTQQTIEREKGRGLMKNNQEPVRGFYHLSEAWYGSANLQTANFTDEVLFGMYHPEGGTDGEMSVRWSELGSKSVPRLQVFDDAWSMLASFTDLLAAMGKHDNECITPKAFCALLLGLGFQDLTPRKNPYGEPHSAMPRRETMLENSLGALVDAIVDRDTSSDINQHVQNAKKLLGRK
jgi:hypothetical protein